MADSRLFQNRHREPYLITDRTRTRKIRVWLRWDSPARVRLRYAEDRFGITGRIGTRINGKGESLVSTQSRKKAKIFLFFNRNLPNVD